MDATGQAGRRGPVLRRIELAAGPVRCDPVAVQPFEVLQQEGNRPGRGPREIDQVSAQDQEIDPRIADVEGIDRTPAYRGLALAVFEDLELAEYGNRIPQITFEIVADESGPALSSILNDATSGLISCTSPVTVMGYAAHGRDQRAALQPLIEQFAVPLFDDGDRLKTPETSVIGNPTDDQLGCGAGPVAHPRLERSQSSATALPKSLILTYYDPQRDYQAGQMRANAGASGGLEEAVELAAALPADRAKALAESRIAMRWAQRDKLVLRLPPDQLQLRPGNLLPGLAAGAVIDDGSHVAPL